MPTLVIALSKPRFPIGQVVITANAEARLNPINVEQGLSRHARGDWGDICPEDASLNEDALKEGDRLVSVYGEGDRKFWIITECDRSVTTVLMPEDY